MWRTATLGEVGRAFCTGLVAFAIAFITPFGATAASAGPRVGTSTADSIGIRLLDAPDTNDPRARLYIVDHIAPGTTIDRGVEISNTSDSPIHILLYSAAATIIEGSFVGAVADTPNELSTWTSVTPPALEIPAGGVSRATVTIAVPSDASHGERYAAVWAETRSTPEHDGVTQVNRVGIRIYLSVGRGGSPPADFTIDSLTAERSTTGQPLIRATVHNIGGRALDMNGVLRLRRGPSGLSAGPFPATLGTTLAIADTQPVTILLDKDLPAGPWEAQIILRSGLLERRARAQVTFPDYGVAPSVTIPNPRPRWVSFATAAVALLIVIGIAARFAPRKRRYRKTEGLNQLIPPAIPQHLDHHLRPTSPSELPKNM